MSVLNNQSNDVEYYKVKATAIDSTSHSSSTHPGTSIISHAVTYRAPSHRQEQTAEEGLTSSYEPFNESLGS
jgi:hypothetical protein